MISPIHIGMVIEEDSEPGFTNVWIPTGNSYVPPGFSEFIYQNTGGQLYGENLRLAKGTAYRCRVASPLTSGAWWRANDGKAASVFDDYGDTPKAYPLYPNSQSSHSSGINGYVFNTDNPRATGIVSTPTLSLAGGNPSHNVGTLPKGIFTKLRVNQWVVVAFLQEGSHPIVINCIHSPRAWKVIST